MDKRPKIFSKKRLDGQITSSVGDLLQQKLPIPHGRKQVIALHDKNLEIETLKPNEQATCPGMEMLPDEMDIDYFGKIPKEKLVKIRNSWDVAATHKPL